MDAKQGDGHAVRYSAVATDSSKDARQREAAMLFSVAEQQLSDELYEEALKAASDAVEKFREQGDSLGVADAVRLAVLAHRWLDTRKEGYTLAKNELATFREAGDERGEAMMKLAIADICTNNMGSKKRDEGFKLGLDARKFFRDAGDRHMEGMALIVLANLHIKRFDKHRDHSARTSEAEAAARVSAEFATLFHEFGDKHREAMGHHGVAVARVIGNLSDDWLEPAEKALALRREIGEQKRIAFELSSIAGWHVKKEEPAQALPVATEALEIYKDVEYLQGCAPALRHMVEAHMMNKEIDEGLKVAREMLEWFKERSYLMGQLSVQDMIANLYSEDESQKEALEAAEAALAISRELGDKRCEALLHDKVAAIHLETEDPKKASGSIMAAMSSFSSLKGRGGKREEAMLLRTAAQVHRGGQNYKAALQSAEKERTLFKKIGDKLHEGIAWISIYQINMDLKNGKAATKACHEAAKLFRRIGDVQREAIAITWSVPALSLRGDMDKALDTAKKGLALAKECGAQDVVSLAEMYIEQITNPEDGEQQKQQQPQDYMSAQAPSAGVPQAPVVACAGIPSDVVQAKIMEVATASTNSGEEIELDVPLMDAGMDSLAAVAFRNQLMADFGMNLPASLIFDAPTIRQVTGEVVETSKKLGISALKA